jgi:hypothetical protein
MQKFPEEWTIIDKMNFLQRKIILNSILYYDHDVNSLSDEYYDSLCKQLVGLHKEYDEIGDIIKDTNYGYVYYDFDGSTGYHLANRLNANDKAYLSSIVVSHLKNKGV